MSRTPKWIRRQNRRPCRCTLAQERDLRWLWRHRETCGRGSWVEEVMAQGIIWKPKPGERF